MGVYFFFEVMHIPITINHYNNKRLLKGLFTLKGMHATIKIEHYTEYGNFSPDKYLASSIGLLTVRRTKTRIDSTLNSEQLDQSLRDIGFEDAIVHDDETVFISSDSRCVLKVYRDKDRPDDQAIVMWTADGYEVPDGLAPVLEASKYKPRDKKRKVSLITKGSDGFNLLEKTLKTPFIEEDNYKLNFSIDEIQKLVSRDSGGLVVFSGPPGTGKSYLIKHLINTIDKKFVYIPVDVAGILADPAFITFAIESLQDSILILEDAESVLVDRSKQHNEIISTILNSTDGILSELLQLKIIATINIPEHIDQALFRKGRMLARVEFQELPADHANRVLERMDKRDTEGNLIKVSTPKVLAELYSAGIDNGFERKTTKIGF